MDVVFFGGQSGVFARVATVAIRVQSLQTSTEKLSHSLRLLEFVPVHSDSQRFVDLPGICIGHYFSLVINYTFN
jgi:hypothetical protein